MLTEKIQLEADETILIQVRKHWFILCMQVFSFFIAAIAPAFLLFTLIAFTDSEIATTLLSYRPYLIFVYTVWLILLWMSLFRAWTDYYLDVWTVTNRRLIAVDQKGLFRRNVASFRLERLQDMNMEINGIIATFLDYGTLEAQTAGHSDEDFRAYGLPKPRELKSLILKAADDLIDEYRDRPRLSNDGV